MTEEELFQAALDKVTTSEREAFLREACGPDDSLRRRVDALLAAHDQPDSLFQQPPLAPLAANASHPQEVVIVCKNHPPIVLGKRQLLLVGSADQAGIVGHRHIETTTTQSVGDRRINVFIQMKTDSFRHCCGEFSLA